MYKLLPQAHAKLLRNQELMHQHPGVPEYQDAEQEAAHKYKLAQQVYLSYLRQKAKVHWIVNGDDNTKVFH